MTIKRIKIVQFAVFQTILFGALGLLCSVVYAFGGLLIDAMVSLQWLPAEKMETPGLSYGTFLAFGALVGMPLIGMLFGFMSGLVGGLLIDKLSSRIRRFALGIAATSFLFSGTETKK